MEPVTPSDQLSGRQRSSYPHHYPPSLLTSFSEQQDATRYLSIEDRAERDRRVSVMSDPSIIDPHLKRDFSIPLSSARISSSSFSSQYKSKTGLGTKNLPHGVQTYERRKSSMYVSSPCFLALFPSYSSYMFRSPLFLFWFRKRSDRILIPLIKFISDNSDSQPSRELDLSSSFGSSSSSRPKSAEQRLQNNARTADSSRPALTHLTTTGPSLSILRRNNSAVPGAMGSSRSAVTVTALNQGAGSASNSRSVSPASLAFSENSRQGLTPTRLDNQTLSPSSARLSPSVFNGPQSTRPKSSSVSQASTSGSSQGGVIRSPSVNSSTTLSRTLSAASGATGTSGASNSGGKGIQRQPSSSRLRGAVPPSRTPPPAFDLPPTPAERPPSPLTFRSPRRLSSSSLLNSPSSPLSDDPSLLAFELPPMTPSSEDSESSKGMHFVPAPNGRGKEKDMLDHGPFSSLKKARNATRAVTSPIANAIRNKDEQQYRSTTQPLHSKSSTQALVQALSGTGRGGELHRRGQHSIKKSASQQSISAFMGKERTRVDSTTSATSSTLMSEESTSLFGSVGKTLKKQRSLHAARGTGLGGLPVPPLPQTQQLRHASSFSASNTAPDAVPEDVRAHSKYDYQASNTGTHRRPNMSVTPVSATTNSSAATSPATPQMQKKRSLFSRERRDSTNQNDRDRQDIVNISHGNDPSNSFDRRKAHNSQTSGLGINLGIFVGHFHSGNGMQVDDSVHERFSASARDVPWSPQQVPQSPERSPSPVAPPTLDQHIVPPKELEMMLKMESLADVQEPSSPLQFSSIASDDAVDEWSLDNSSGMEAGSVRSRMGSVSDASSALGRSESTSIKSTPSSPIMSTRHFASASTSITVRLQSDRPATASRLPMRNSSAFQRELSGPRKTRPSTAQTFGVRNSIDQRFSPLQGLDPSGSESPSESDFVPIALPPPPRRKGMAISVPRQNDETVVHPPPPPLSQSSGRLQRLASHETITTYNPNRGSIFRKPSFLNIDDEYTDQVGTMSSVPEDSFLILEHGKDSLDIRRSFDSSDGVLF